MPHHPLKILMIIISTIILLCTGMFSDEIEFINSDHEIIFEETMKSQNPNPSNSRASLTEPRSSNRAPSDWIMHLYGPNHNSYSSAIGPTNSSVLWYNTTGGRTFSSPCVANGRVFIGVGETMKCYYENNGTLAWSMSPDNKVAGSYGVCSSPAYANGCIYFGADKIYCVWETNGTVRWRVNKQNIKHGDGTPTLAYGKVFIAGSDYKLYCIDQINGSVLWTFQTLNNLPNPPIIEDNWGLYAAPAVVNDSVYLAACDWHLYQINVTQPTSVATANHTFKMGWASYSSPVVVGDKIYVGCGYDSVKSTCRFYCLYASNLTKVWEFNPGADTSFFSSAGYYNGNIYIGSVDGNIYCLNAVNGSEVWKYDIGGTWSSPAITTERIYIGSKSGYIYCFNLTQPSTPDYYWRYELTGEVDSSPAVVPGRVYIGTHGHSGRVYCFGTKDNFPPQVTANFPANAAPNIPVTTKINVTFNEQVNPNTITSSTFSIKDSTMNPVSGSITYDEIIKTAEFSPNSNLKRGEEYTVKISTGIQDYWANSLDGNKNDIQDGSPTDDHTWSFTTSSNNPPKLTAPSVTPTFGYISTEFEFKVVYTDLDNDTPKQNPAYIRVFIDDDLTGRAMIVNTSAPLIFRDGKFDNGEEYIYRTTLATYGQHKYRFVSFDGLDQNETIEFHYPRIIAKPTIDTIGEQNAYEDIDLVLYIGDKIHDGDTSLDQLNISVNSSFASIDDFNITFNYPNEFNYPSGKDHEIVAINVSDTLHNVSQDIKINVFAINDAPTIEGVPNIQVSEGEEFHLNVTQYIQDIDNTPDELSIKVNSSYADVNDKNITFYYPNSSGIVTEQIELNVSDGDLTDSQNIIVTIIPEGAEFLFLPVPEQFANEDEEHVLDISNYIKIIGNLSIDDIEVQTNSSYCTITNKELTFNYPNSFNYPSGRNTDYIQVNISYEKQIQTQNVTMKVTAVNDAPILTILESPILGLANSSISFKVKYQDIDGSESPIVELVILDEEHQMTLKKGDIHGEGGIFEDDIELPAGVFEYYYLADDGESEINSLYKSKLFDLKILEYSEYGDDFDSDSIPDAWELKFGLNPFDENDAKIDSDSDNYTNLQEYLGDDGLAGGNDSTDPFESTDFPVHKQSGDGDGSDGDGSEDDDEKEGEKESDGLMNLFTIIFIIVIVVLVLLIFILMSRGKKGSSDTYDDGYTPTYQPESEQVVDVEE